MSFAVVSKLIDVYVEMSLIDMQTANLDEREEIKVLNNMTKIYESQQKIVNAEYLPQLAAFGNYYVQNPDHLAHQENELTFNAGLSLSIPVFHWGERNLKNTEAKMSIQSAQYELDHTKEMLTLEMHQAIFTLRESMTQLQFTVEALGQADENLQLETNRLKEQVSTTTDLLNAQMQWQKAQADYIGAKATVKISEANYLKSIGRLNP